MSDKPQQSDIVMDFLKGFDESRFPAEFLSAYDIMECLAQGERGETFLALGRESGKYAVAKCYPAHMLPHVQEHELLKKLSHKGLPAYLGSYGNERMLCVLREYVEGSTLECSALEQPFSKEQVIRIGISLCDILQYLHTQDPPIIHRDIKPKNIILRGDGSVALIDFGISRVYRKGADTDTMNFGTKCFSAPEQYGYAQTDPRSDIFSLGMVLGYLLTGSTRPEDFIGVEDKQLAKVIRTCTAFDPSNRYRSAAECRRALCALLPKQRKKRCALKIAAALLAVAAMATAAILLPKTAPEAPVIETSQPEFKEPLIESAVRMALGRGEGEPISAQELASVEGIYIFANTVAASPEEFYAAADEWYSAGMTPQGSITSLEDVALLPNLRTLCVAAQQISDISPLAELPFLEKVELKHNRVSDVSPLCGLASLASAGLNGNPIADLAPLAGCATLRFLDLCDVDGYDPAFLNELGNFEFLDVANATSSYSCLGARSIRQLKLGYSGISSLDCLKDITGLESLEVKHSKLTSLDGIELHQGLTYLNIAGCTIDDLSPIKALPALATLVVSNEALPAAKALNIEGLSLQTE